MRARVKFAVEKVHRRLIAPGAEGAARAERAQGAPAAVPAPSAAPAHAAAPRVHHVRGSPARHIGSGRSRSQAQHGVLVDALLLLPPFHDHDLLGRRANLLWVGPGGLGGGRVAVAVRLLLRVVTGRGAVAPGGRVLAGRGAIAPGGRGRVLAGRGGAAVVRLLLLLLLLRRITWRGKQRSCCVLCVTRFYHKTTTSSFTTLLQKSQCTNTTTFQLDK